MNWPTESWGPQPSSDSERNWICPCVFTSSKQRRKRKFNVVFVRVVKKSVRHVQNFCCFSFTYWDRFVWRSRSFAVAVVRSSLLPRFIDVRKRLGIRTRFWYKRLPYFHKIYMSFKIRSINELLRLSGNRYLGREEKKSPLFLEKKIFFSETSRVEWIEANCALKIITLDILLSF